MDWKCKNNPEWFCYICGNVDLSNHQAKITDFVKKAFRDYFVVKLGNQDKPFAPHVGVQYLWRNSGIRGMASMPFAISIIGR